MAAPACLPLGRATLACVPTHLIAPLEPDDALDVAHAYAAMQACTYATWATAGFNSLVFADMDRRVRSLKEADVCMVAKNDRGNVIGLAVAQDGPEWWERPHDDDFVWPATNRTLSSLFTMPEAHGTGLGHALLEAALPDDEPAYLWVMRRNPRAVRFYAKHGFVPDGYTKRTLGWGDMDLLRMVRQ